MPEDSSRFSEPQAAIFNFLFVLIDLYKLTMPAADAINKGCDWLISLANDIKEKNIELVAEKAANNQKLIDSA